MKQITHEQNGMTIVMREKTGADTIDRSFLLYALRQHAQKSLPDKEGKLPDRVWVRIGFVCDVIQQTVTVTGRDVVVPDVFASDDTHTVFYDRILYGQDAALIVQAFQGALKKLEVKDTPPLVEPGETNATKSQSEPTEDSSPVSPILTKH